VNALAAHELATVGDRRQPLLKEVFAMLVLSRKVGEEIVIGSNIRVRVLEVHGNQVRLGFVAPREVNIQRQELLTPGRQKLPRPSSETLPAPDAVIAAPPAPES
jgi:carbon storage regulator